MSSQKAPSVIALKMLLCFAVVASLSMIGPPTSAREGGVFVYVEGNSNWSNPGYVDSLSVSLCFGKRYGDAVANLESRSAAGVWRSHSDETSDWYLDSKGCVVNVLAPAQLARSQDANIDVRLTVPQQKAGKRVIPSRSKNIGTFKTWKIDPEGDKSVPVPHLEAFSDRYGSSVATILCAGLTQGGVSQGTGFSVPVSLSEDIKSRAGGSTYLVTAGHVVDDCFFANHRNVSVLYKGQTYPGYVWSSFGEPDLGAVITNAPIPAAKLAGGVTKRPRVGDVGVSVSSAGGVPGTVTQGQISGVSQSQLNSVIPAGRGASGGPVFNNVGEVIGVVVAGNFSLTELVAIPSFCGTVYSSEGCSVIW